MATLTGTTIAGSYKDLLKIAEASKQAGLDTTLRAVEDGDATASALNLSTTSASIGHTVTTSDAGSKALFIDANTSGVAAQDSTGLHIDFDRTVAGSGTAAHNDIGIDLDVNSASLGTSSLVGMDIDVVGAASGTSTATGLAVTVGSADTNYAAVFSGGNVGIGTNSPDFQLEVEANTTSYSKMLSIKNIHATGIPLIAIGDDMGADDGCAILGYDNSNNVAWLGVNGASIGTGLHVKKSGNVGIGTSSPSFYSASYAGLHVYHSNNPAILKVEAGDGSSTRIQLKNTETDITLVADGGVLNIDGGNVGIGDDSPDAHLDIEDAAVSLAGTAEWRGLAVNHTKTAGASTASSDFYGIDNSLVFNDGDAFFGALYGTKTTVTCADSVGESVGIIGSLSNAILNGGDVNYIRGVSTSVIIDGGTIDTGVVGHHLSIDVDGGTHTGYLYGLSIDVDSTVNPGGGMRANMWQVGGSAMGDDDFFFYALDGKNSDVSAHLTAAGVLTVDSSAADGASDYAEWFESKDGNVIAIGSTVKLDGGKLVACSEGDSPMGVIRPKDANVVQAGGRSLKWQGKYLTDDYNAPLYEDYEWVIWKEDVDFDEYISRGKTEEEQKQYHKVEGSKAVLYKDGDEIPEDKEVGDEKEAAVPDTYYRKHSYYADRVPEEFTVPEDARVIQCESQRKKRNPDYDESLEYKPRKERDEWHLVGLLGQIPITKGQPTGNWIKMKDVSDTVEMYFVK